MQAKHPDTHKSYFIKLLYSLKANNRRSKNHGKVPMIDTMEEICILNVKKIPRSLCEKCRLITTKSKSLNRSQKICRLAITTWNVFIIITHWGNKTKTWQHHFIPTRMAKIQRTKVQPVPEM